MRLSLLGLSLCALTLAAAGPATGVPKPQAPAEAPAIKPRVRITTSYGPFVVELEPSLAPGTVANFLRYVKEGHYVGTTFHRVIPGFMVQGGGLLDDLSEKPTHDAIQNEAPATFRGGLKNTRGTIAMARKDDPQSATAQFFINTVDNPALDFSSMNASGYGYCAFGRVVEGMEVVDKIEKVRTIWSKGMQSVPEYALKIKAVELLPEK